MKGQTPSIQMGQTISNQLSQAVHQQALAQLASQSPPSAVQQQMMSLGLTPGLSAYTAAHASTPAPLGTVNNLAGLPAALSQLSGIVSSNKPQLSPTAPMMATGFHAPNIPMQLPYFQIGGQP